MKKPLTPYGNIQYTDIVSDGVEEFVRAFGKFTESIGGTSSISDAKQVDVCNKILRNRNVTLGDLWLILEFIKGTATVKGFRWAEQITSVKSLDGKIKSGEQWKVEYIKRQAKRWKETSTVKQKQTYEPPDT